MHSTSGACSSALVLALPANPEGERQWLGEDFAQGRIVPGLAGNVAQDPPR